MRKAPDQQIFDELFKISKALGYDTYDHLPKEEVNYPFVEIGEIRIVPIETKSYALGKVSATVHVWGGIHNRKEVSDMMNAILNTSVGIVDIPNGHQWRLQLNDTVITILPDSSTHMPLWHGVLQMAFKFI